ncbi:zinc finger protein 503 [Latimeria chalumnae]|uniref:Zinc finger protein 503 n=1 Tax=Latimeria chalumnae TaxID=7897 RepID=H3BFL6_LATCH|nr:PREDICTED: zinc finger protein 503 [Latimeria chalumnae]|eukprot:XP_005988320.1 PREDICTED: zinc finger protein 503 [Latimeria chalumnae]
MITSPSASAIRNPSSIQAADSGTQPGRSSASSGHKPFVHSVPPSDPSRQAKRLPIKVLKMLTARTGHILHPEYLQPLPSTPVSPIELDAKKSPLALLAQTCSQIGKPDPSPSSKLSSVTSNGTSDKDSKSGPLKLSDIGVEDKSSFKPYSKPSEKKESSSGVSGGEKSGFRVPSATCQPFTPRTGSPNSSTSASPLPQEAKSGDPQEKKDSESTKNGSSEGSATTSISHSRISVSCAGINVEVNQHQETTSKPISTESSSSSTVCSSASVLGSGLVAPVSPYKPGQTVFPLPPASMTYPGTLAGAYAGYPPQFLPHGVALDPTKSSSLVGAQLASSLGCSKPAGSSPLAGASPPSVMTASLCRDPYCLSYHCASHLASAANASCTHDPTAALKTGYPLVYPTHPLHSVHSSLAAGAAPHTLAGHPLYPYGFMLPNDPLPHVCNWVSANGPCDKRFATSEELLNHLRTHTAFPGTDKLISGYPSSSSLAAAMACHMHIPPSGAPGSPSTFALRSPHHALGLGSRYHPYSKSPLPTPGAPVPVPAATGHYYSPYALYGQKLTTASALGYQ